MIYCYGIINEKSVIHMELSRQIYNIRPDDKRSPEEEAVYDVLEELSIPFERMDWLPEDEGSENIYEYLGILHLKNLLLCNAQKTKFYLLVMPASVPFKSNVLSKQLGTPRFSFAPEENLRELLHVKPGSASILGLHNDIDNVVNLCIDERVLEQEYYGCHPCVNTTSLKIKTDDILNKFLPHTGHYYTIVRM